MVKIALQELPGCFLGAMKGTQVTDITSTNALVIEKGLDLQGQSSVAQADVAQFYDRVPTTSMCPYSEPFGEDTHLDCGVSLLPRDPAIRFQG
eukprot:12416954-Karenia_brevis.AAC.1